MVPKQETSGDMDTEPSSTPSPGPPLPPTTTNLPPPPTHLMCSQRQNQPPPQDPLLTTAPDVASNLKSIAKELHEKHRKTWKGTLPFNGYCCNSEDLVSAPGCLQYSQVHDLFEFTDNKHVMNMVD